VEALARDVERQWRAERQPQLGPIKKVKRGGPMELSFAQKRLWFLDQLEPGGAFYNIPAAVKLEGEMDIKALSRSFSEIVRRHESLRTVFGSEGGEPVQLIKEAEDVDAPLIDLCVLREEEKRTEAERITSQEASGAFDLEQGPLLRVRLIRMGEREHIGLVNMHHIVSDGWSMGVLIREIGALYEAYSEGRESPLEELEIQ